jgi:DHA3 family macrolide efflux protein-like MFS transporter
MALVLFFSAGDKDNSIAAVGALVYCETLPGSLAAFVSGAVIDSRDKRRMMVGMDILRAGLVMTAALLPAALLVYAMTAAASVASAFFNPARMAALPLAVDGALLTKANAMDQASSTLVMIAGPALGAYLFVSAGLKATLTLDALSFLLSAALLFPLRIRSPFAAYEMRRCSMAAQVREGWHYIVRHRVVMHLMGATVVSLLCVGLWMPVAPSFVQGFLSGSATALAYQLALFGIGGIAGSLAAPYAVRRLGKGTTFSTMLLAEATAMIIYSITPSLALSNLIICLWGAIVSMMLVPYYSLLQERVDEGFLGRVSAVARQAESAAAGIAIAAAVALRSVLEPQQMFLLAGCAYLAFAALALRTRSGRDLLRSR